MIYDQRNNTTDSENAINSANNTICYIGRNRSGKTYLNGVLNESIKSEDTIGKKHLITATFLGGENTDTPVIGSTNASKGYYSKMCLYKMFCFNKELNEKEINDFINTFNLLENVDNIEL